MKNFLVILLILLTLIALQGCSTELSDIDQAKETVTQYMNIIYKVENYTLFDIEDYDSYMESIEDYKELALPYVTQKFMEASIGNRIPTWIKKSASVNEFNLRVSNIVLDQIQQDNDKIYMDYELTLVLNYSDDHQEEVIKTGKLQLLKVDEEWKLNHEKAGNYPIANRNDSIVNKVISTYENDSFEIKLIQHEEIRPPTPDDDNFSIYTSAYYGHFSLQLSEDDRVIDSLSLTNHFGAIIGFIGDFDFVDDDINGDGLPDFNIGIMKEPYFEFIVFTIKDKSFQIFMFDGSYILKSTPTNHSDQFERGPEGELIITLPNKYTAGYYEKRYFWNETSARFESNPK